MIKAFVSLNLNHFNPVYNLTGRYGPGLGWSLKAHLFEPSCLHSILSTNSRLDETLSIHRSTLPFLVKLKPENNIRLLPLWFPLPFCFFIIVVMFIIRTWSIIINVFLLKSGLFWNIKKSLLQEPWIFLRFYPKHKVELHYLFFTSICYKTLTIFNLKPLFLFMQPIHAFPSKISLYLVTVMKGHDSV